MRTTAGAPPVGAQIQIRGGLARGGLPYADAVGARAVQVFVGNPRGWRRTAGDPAQDDAFTAGCAERGIPAFVQEVMAEGRVDHVVHVDSAHSPFLSRRDDLTRHLLDVVDRVAA